MKQELFILIPILIFWLGFLEFRFYKLNKNFNNIFKGKKDKNLEILTKELVNNLDKSEKEIFEISGRVKELENIIPKTIQKIGFIRFNPFKEVGGDQSFSAVLLDKEDNGLLITSLFTREGNRIYGKSIKKGVSKYELLEEEKEAIKKALNSSF